MMARGKKIPFWKKRAALNSLRNSLRDTQEKATVMARATSVNPIHHRGRVHQKDCVPGSKPDTIPVKVRLGSAMSMDSTVRAPRMVPAITRLLSSQKPRIPMMSRVATAVKVVANMPMDPLYVIHARCSSIFSTSVVGS